MNPLFGNYQPLNTPVHSCPLWAKGLAVLALTLALALTSSWLVSLLCLALVLALGTLARIPWRVWARSLRALWLLLLILGAYYLLADRLALGADVLLTLLTMIAASRVLLWSTPMPVLMDGFVVLCRPLAWVGGSPERVGLALALMVRSIPVLMDSWGDLKAAADARGIRIPAWRLFTPLVVAAVAYAQETGDALAARGLDS